MSLPRHTSSGGGGVSASRSVALDLMLRTFMNSSQFQASRPRVWENVSRLVPGTTPQQCYERWEELRTFAGNQASSRDCSELTAYGRPVSQRFYGPHKQANRPSRATISHSPSSQAAISLSPPLPCGDLSILRPQSRSEGSVNSSGRESQLTQRREKVVRHGGGEGREGENLASLYQNVMESKQGELEVAEKDDPTRSKNSVCAGDRGQEREGEGVSSKSAASRESDMIIHVFDEQRKSKREFYCPREVLVREMRYFSEYLSSDTQLWGEVDISVHCDIPVFEWLMRYAKRGLLQGPRGEILDYPLETPALEAGSVVSILISSDFLKMDTLVEECLQYCHDNLSTVLAAPTNMGCISDRLRERLAAKFTPAELEEVVDKKDKIKSKLFIHHIQKLFSPSHSYPQCPANASTLYKCRHCEKLLTIEQTYLLPCTDTRLQVHFGGRLVYCHERDEGWSVSGYLSSLQKQHHLSPRDIYWRLWGLVNCLTCSGCGRVFQCRDLSSCYHHSQPALAGRPSTGPPVHICCGSPPANTSPFPLPQSGCCVRDHVVVDPSSPLFSLLLSLRDVICPTPTSIEKKRKTHTHSLSINIGSTQFNLLTTADLRGSRHTHTSCGTAGQRKREGAGDSGEIGRQNGSVAKEQFVNNAVAKETTLSARQQVQSELSELEEDEEEEEERKPHPPPKHSHRRDSNNKSISHTKNSSVRRKHSSAAVGVGAGDWVWDSCKPHRWNQDRQRENDERRLGLLCDKLSRQVSPHSLSSTPHSLSSTPHSLSSTPSLPLHHPSHTLLLQSSAGGIFAQLEAQFKVHQAATPLPPPAHTTGSRLPGRKR